MNAIDGIEPQLLFSALTLLVIALFVMSGYRPASRWRRPLRLGAIALFCIALAAAIVQSVEWLAATSGR